MGGRWVLWTLLDPGRSGSGWSPYCNGSWQQTDAGWYWASDEPWGWATYHYGRWDLDPQFGWYWVPQTQWAPAWVSWREGGGYIGWCPLGPTGGALWTSTWEAARREDTCLYRNVSFCHLSASRWWLRIELLLARP